MEGNRLYSLYIILLLIPTICAVNIDTYREGEYIVNQLAYYEAEVLKNTTLTNTTYYSTAVFQDLNNDSINEVYVYVPSTKICFIDGASFTNWSCIQFYPETLDSLIPIGDVNNDGISELILVTSIVDYNNNNTLVKIYLVNPFAGYIEFRNETVINRRLTSSIIGYYVTLNGLTIYEGNNISIAYNELALENRPPVSVIVYYNTETNCIEYREINGRVYSMYTNTLLGDLDNDGVLETTSDYKLITYIDVIMYGAIPYFYSNIEFYHRNTLLFRKTSSPYVLYAGAFPTNNGRELLLVNIELEITLIPRTEFTIKFVGYGLNGEIKFNYELPKGYVPIIAVPLGDRLIVVHVNATSTFGGESYTYIDLVSTIDGAKLDSKRYVNISLINLIGLGNIEKDEYKEVLFVYMSDEGEYYVKILKVSNSIIVFDLFGLDPSYTYPVVNIYEINGSNYIVSGTVVDNNAVLMLYRVKYYGDTTPPIVRLISPLPNQIIGKLPYTIYGQAYDDESGIDIGKSSFYLIDETGERIDLINITYLPNRVFEAVIPSNVSSGLYKLFVNISNGAGLFSVVVTNIIIDLDPPIIHYEIPLRYNMYLDINKIKITDGRAALSIIVYLTDYMLDRVNINLNNSSIYWKYPINEPTLSVMVNITDVSEGTYVLRIEAFDKAGHNSTIEKQFIVDLTKPVIEEFVVNITSITENYVNLTINYRIRDNLSGIDRIELIAGNTVKNYTIDSLRIEDTVNLTNIRFTGENITVSLRVWDKAGWQITENKTINITPITTTPPTETPTETPTVTPTETSPSPTETVPAGKFDWTPIIIIIIIVIIIGAILFYLRTRK